jgi:hypothetical protein
MKLLYGVAVTAMCFAASPAGAAEMAKEAEARLDKASFEFFKDEIKDT